MRRLSQNAPQPGWLMISYSDNSIVDITDLQALAEKQYDVLIEKVELSHSKQGRSSISKVDEYIFICRSKEFSQQNPSNTDFIRKYLTLTKCDLFFADKAVFVEGASERLLLPDMIDKCAKTGDFDSREYKLPAQYYALVEIDGAYAYKFIPFAEFLGIPCLILTDLVSVSGQKAANERIYDKSVPVSCGETTSNETLKWWVRKIKGLPEDDNTKISLTEITSMSAADKTRHKCHIEFQTTEDRLCGHSLEEAIRNVNRTHYKLRDTPTEDDLEFSGKSKTDFALDLICKCEDYAIPAYIKDGLVWLNDQRVLE